MIIDEWSMLGSSNLNSRSQLHDLEIDVVPVTQTSRQALINQYLDDLAHSKRIVYRDIMSRYGNDFLRAVFFRLVQYWF